MAAIMPNYRGTSTTATNDMSATDTSYMYCDEYEKQKTLDEVEMYDLKEELNIPKFNDVKKRHNTLKPNTKIAFKQHNIHIRNAL